jgi:putative hydrolase of the HAD superfamily
VVDVDAVLLDAGGVLLLPNPDVMRRLLAIDADDETCRRAHYAGMREVDRLGTADWAAVDHVIAQAAGFPADRLDEAVPLLDKLYVSGHEPWVPIAGAAEAMLQLEAAGYGLAIVSNAEGTMEKQLADGRVCSVDGGAVAKVAVVVDSHVVGIEKPDPRIFGLALDVLGVAPNRCVYVGDTVLFDVCGARAAGIEPVHVDPYGLCPDDDHRHVTSLASFADELCGGGGRESNPPDGDHPSHPL